MLVTIPAAPQIQTALQIPTAFQIKDSRTLISKIRSLFRAIRSTPAKDFDARFYLSHYEDLKSLKTAKQALRHYIEYGKSEGRFPDADSYEAHVGVLRAEFDVTAYKFYNKDLARRFVSEDEFFRHYVHHGRKEGRISRFPEKTQSPKIIPDADKWQSAFVTSDFLAWCGDELTPLPTTREEALAAFKREGIDKLWPINLEYAFDPDFIRSNDLMPNFRDASDPDLYRAWLTEGFPAGVAPNETVFLAPYMGGVPFSADLEWARLGQAIGMPRSAPIAKIVVALFDLPPKKLIDLVGKTGSRSHLLLARIASRALAVGDFDKAEKLLTHCAIVAPKAEVLAQLGNVYHIRGKVAESLEIYQAAAAMEGAPLDAYLQIATIFANRHDFADAFSALAKARRAWRDKPKWMETFESIVQCYFDHQSAKAHELYQSSDLHNAPTARQMADGLLTTSLDYIRDLYLELDNLPAPVGGNPDGYVAILANDDLAQCVRYRIQQKILTFESIGIPVRVFSHIDAQAFVDSLIGARAVIFYRVAAVPAILRAILHANAMNLETWY